MLLQETSSVPLDPPKNWEFNDKLIAEIRALPRRSDITLRFVDLDGTLLNDQKRFEILPELLKHRGDLAYKYLESLHPQGTAREKIFLSFLEKLIPTPGSSTLKGSERFFDANNVNDIIITAGDRIFQLLKTELSGIQPNKERVITLEDASMKPEYMLRQIFKKGYLPGKIKFYDDRMENFAGAEDAIAEAVGVDTEFYQAIQTGETVRTVKTRVGRAMEMMMN